MAFLMAQYSLMLPFKGPYTAFEKYQCFQNPAPNIPLCSSLPAQTANLGLMRVFKVVSLKVPQRHQKQTNRGWSDMFHDVSWLQRIVSKMFPKCPKHSTKLSCVSNSQTFLTFSNLSRSCSKVSKTTNPRSFKNGVFNNMPRVPQYVQVCQPIA